MPNNDFNLNSFLPYQLSVAASRVSREFSTLYRAKFGISVPEWRVVAHLSQAGSVSVREIQQRVDMDKSKVSRAATRLEKNGYVEKKPDPDDGRLIALTLTTKGRAMMDEIIPIARLYEAELLERLDDMNSLKRALEELADSPKD